MMPILTAASAYLITLDHLLLPLRRHMMTKWFSSLALNGQCMR